MQQKTFTVDFDKAQLVGDIQPDGAIPEVLFLHGAGLADRKRYDYIRQSLAKEEIASIAFDFIGHGETGGDLSASSLRERTDQANAVIDTLSLPQPFSVVAGSMSAHTAIQLTQFHEINTLILLVPGIYREDVYDQAFNDTFSEKIREEKSWELSDVFEILGSFDGKLLIIAAEKDEVVPAEIPQRLYDAAKYAQSRTIHTVKGASHKIHEFLNDPAHKDAFNECYELIRNTLLGL